MIERYSNRQAVPTRDRMALPMRIRPHDWAQDGQGNVFCRRCGADRNPLTERSAYSGGEGPR